jgi:serine/threonine protein kinase
MGEFGCVFRGLYDSQTVAVKRLRVKAAMTDQHRKALDNEVSALMRFSTHTRLVAFVGACATELMIVTEFMPGGSLRTLLHVTKAPLQLHRRMQMVQQVAEGIAFLHSEGIIHRSLKSTNILLDKANDLKISDFGLARILLGIHGAEARDDCESARYWAPEVFEASNRVTPKVDIWALGCIVNEIFGSLLPWAEYQMAADIARAVTVERRVPELAQTLTAQQRAGITACWQFESRDRPTAAEVFYAIKDMSGKMFPPAPR